LKTLYKHSIFDVLGHSNRRLPVISLPVYLSVDHFNIIPYWLPHKQSTTPEKNNPTFIPYISRKNYHLSLQINKLVKAKSLTEIPDARDSCCSEDDCGKRTKYGNEVVAIQCCFLFIIYPMKRLK
jgi:hypothetical protein